MKRPLKRRGQQKPEDKFELDRLIMFTGDVEAEEIGEIIRQILEINEEDEKIELRNTNYIRKPIKLIINTFGGSVYDGLALIDVMDGSLTPVHTYCYGAAMSMGLIILACGHYRYCGKNATLMYHEAAYSIDSEKIQAHKAEMKEVERIENLCDSILLERTKLGKKVLQNIKNKKLDWYLTADDGLKYKIIDEII
jgi:ATP-dependent Clp protease protease subunit